MKVNCPTCQTGVEWQETSTYRPFCSKRCQMIDLGEWAEENHSIAGEPAQDINSMTDEALEAYIEKMRSPHQSS
ncbi:DNA gyrase inhibitor YacG [Alteromonas sediminis]|uniref:DNA gyrase inhibitor YacG n=1 Tax=Alteromonas sediminis TaxID=2259342 RepID=A0A3N5Y294_9ALTE|nr:DNA gyrase inhibitor YacG [Alteromonas sediminis]RPJ67957.1 DNA gyrase inhibitor YacG [Alteromonas sediminis]